MTFFKWALGRQGTGYFKLKLYSSSFFGMDGYVLKFPAGCEVPKHKDPVEEGYKHFRINITIKKSSAKTDRMFILGKVYRWWRMELFRPDLYEHGLTTLKDSIYMLSFGFKVKAKPIDNS